MDIIENPQKDAQRVTFQASQSLKKRNPLLVHHDGNFHLMQQGKFSKIPFENVKGIKSKFTPEQLKSFQENGGYFWLSNNDQDDYFVEAKVRGEGGGYLTGLGAKWTVRAVGYGTVVGMLLTGHIEVIAEAELIIQTTEAAANFAFGVGCAIPGTP